MFAEVNGVLNRQQLILNKGSVPAAEYDIIYKNTAAHKDHSLHFGSDSVLWRRQLLLLPLLLLAFLFRGRHSKLVASSTHLYLQILLLSPGLLQHQIE